MHHLLQEYFAARALAAAPRPELASTTWRAEELSPRLEEVLASLPDFSPLPKLPTTGWEETYLLAAEMVANPEAVVSALAEVNLPLAGRCAASPNIAISPVLRERLQHALIERSREPAADLRPVPWAT